MSPSSTLAGDVVRSPIESKQNWGTASTQLVRALMDEHAVAIVALDRDSAHLWRCSSRSKVLYRLLHSATIAH